MKDLDGAHFPTLESAVKKGKEFAIKNHFEAHVDRSYKKEDSKRLVCRNRVQFACPWKLDVIKDTDTLTWTHLLVEKLHSEDCETSRKAQGGASHTFEMKDRSDQLNMEGENNASKYLQTESTNSSGTTNFSNPIDTNLIFGRKQLILSHDMRWGSAKEASRAVNDFALFAQRKRARMDKKTSGGRNKKYRCSSENCSWYVRLLRAPKTESWKISSMNLQHSETCTGIAQPTARQLADMASFRQAVVTHSKSQGKLLTDDFLSTTEEGITIPLRLAYRAKKLISVHSQDDLVESYKFIPSLLARFQEKNSNSIVEYTADALNQFVRAFIMPGVFHQVSLAMQKIVGIEVISCNGHDYKGYILLLLGRDGNYESQVLAFGLVPEPSSAQVSWFLSLIHNAMNLENYPIVCNALYPGVVEGVRIAIPSSRIRLCIKSLIEAMNQDKSISKLGSAEMLVWELHNQETASGFQDLMHQLDAMNSSAATYLRGLDENLWASYKLNEEHMHPLFGWSTTSYTPGIYGATGDNCDEAPFDLLYNYLTRMMDMTFLKSQLANKLMKDCTLLTPGAEEKYRLEISESMQYMTRASTDVLAFVWKSGARPKANYRVDLAQGTCTCTFLRQMGIPCRHFIAAARHYGQDELILNHFNGIYKSETYALGFQKGRIEIPLEGDMTKDETIRPAASDGKLLLKLKKTRPTTNDEDNRRIKIQKSSNLSHDTSTDMDMNIMMTMSMGLPGIPPQIIQQYPVPTHAYLQQIQMQMNMHQQDEQVENQQNSTTFSLV